MGKPVFLCLCIAFICFSCRSDIQVSLEDPKVDKRVELLSIVFRLAGNEEYGSTRFMKYTDRVEEHFNGFRDHPLIGFAERMRMEHGVSYDAVMGLAICLDGNLDPIVPFSEYLPDPRWTVENANVFVGLLKEFYVDSDFESYFLGNSDFYGDVVSRFLPLYNGLDLNWYGSFFGEKPQEKFTIFLGLGNNGSYGPHYIYPDGVKEVFAIMGVWNMDDFGNPQFPEWDYLPVLIHEFNHSFVNPMVDRSGSLFEASASSLAAEFEEVLAASAYKGWKTFVCECLVRAAVLKYVADHGLDELQIENRMGYEIRSGFVCIREIYAELANYDANRGKYPTLESFLPVLAGVMERFVLQREGAKG